MSGIMNCQVEADTQAPVVNKIQDLFEPSGVVQLNDGRLLAVEDESVSPLVLMTPTLGVESFSISSLHPNVLRHPAMINLNDLEGVAKGPDGHLYTITSQSRKSNGKRARDREKIIRFFIQGNRLVTSDVRRDFRKRLIKAYPILKDAAKERDVKDQGGLNIEGLTFGPGGDVLWIGLRAPLFEDQAILVPLLNPRRALEIREAYRFSEEPVFLYLDGGGIRGMAYDPTLSGYLILSQRENTKKEKPFKLWLWSGDSQAAPRRVRIAGIKKLRSTEGIAPVRLMGKDQLLLLNDDGNRLLGKPASYLLVDYTQLSIEAVR